MNFKEGEVFYFNKLLGWMFFKVVGYVCYYMCWWMKVKKLKVGYVGIFDFLVIGVMIVCIGKVIKRIEEFQYYMKEYVVIIQLGVIILFYDLEYEIDVIYFMEYIICELVEKMLKMFVGEIQQIFFVFLVCKVDGVCVYDLVCKGQEVELKLKLLVIDEIELLECNLLEIKIWVVCSKGIYICVLVCDIGEVL